MGATSIANARSTLYALLCSNTTTGAPHSTLTAVTRIYDHEPMAGDIIKPVSVTLLLRSVDSDFFYFDLRVYATDGTQAITQARIDVALQQIDARLSTTAEHGPSNWTCDWLEDIAAWMAVSQVLVPREDNQ
jgi:hypothetical protein